MADVRDSPFVMAKTMDVYDFARSSDLDPLGVNISPVLEKTLSAVGDISHFTYED